MKIGLNFFPIKLREMAQAAQLADRLGYESLWYGEHVIVPWEYDESKYPGDQVPFAPDSKIIDPFALFAHLAGITRHIRLGSGISILPLRDPFLTARTLVTVDLFSDGRLDLGVGVGWMVDEFEFVGRNFANRGPVLDEFLEVLDLLWREERVEYHGKHFDFRPVGFRPKPIQKPRIPVHVGGYRGRSLERAALYDGWYGGAASPEAAREIVEELHRQRRNAGTSENPFQISVLLFWQPTIEQIDAFEKAGVDQLVVTPWEPLMASWKALAGIQDFAESIGMQPPLDAIASS